MTVAAKNRDEVLKELDNDGKGKVEGKKAGLSVAVIERPAGQALIVLGGIELSKLKKHEKTLAKILQSLRPIK